MRILSAVFPATAAIAALGSVATSAPEQTYPGQATQARVWVQNQGRQEAVPVDLRDVNTDSPLRVQVVNGEGRVATAALVRLGRQQWDYLSVTVSGGPDAATLLNARGAEGWETTGIAWSRPDGTTLLLKRPR